MSGNPIIRSTLQLCRHSKAATRSFRSSAPALTGCPMHANNDMAPTLEAVDATGRSFAEMPTLKGWPVLGTVPNYLTKIWDFHKPYQFKVPILQKMGPIYREKILNKYICWLNDPEVIQELSQKEGKYPYRGEVRLLQNFHKEKFGRVDADFPSAKGAAWRKMRSPLQKLFGRPQAPVPYLGDSVSVAREFCDNIRRCRDEQGELADSMKWLLKYTQEATGLICFGDRLNVLQPDSAENEEGEKMNSATVNSLILIAKSCLQPPFTEFGWRKLQAEFNKEYNTVVDITNRHIQNTFARITKRQEDSLQETQSMLEKLVSVVDDDAFTASDAVNMCTTLFLAGIDSTANTMAFVLYHLAANPEKQQRLFEEIRRVLPNNKPLNVESLKELRYLRACLKESYRLSHPVLGHARIMDEDISLGGYTVPKGTMCTYDLSVMCRMEKYFERADEFIPERWLRHPDETCPMTSTSREDVTSPGDQEDLPWIHPKAAFLVLPFGMGPRSCIGRRFAEQEMQCAVVTLLQSFELRHHGEKVQPKYYAFVQPDIPLRLSFHDRE